MRLKRITVKGFMPFKDEQTVDLEQVDLFALWGPTGSGKSSLLDAVTFGLYGKTPRWGNSDRKQMLVSMGAREARVELAFTVGSERYEVVRTITLAKRGTANSEVEVRREAGGQMVSLTAGERATGGGYDDVLQKILGMTYETFTHTLLLPQGQFDRFLKPEQPRHRKAMLIDIAGLGVYDRLFEQASLKLDASKQQLALCEAALAEHRHYTPERLQEVEQETERLTQEHASAALLLEDGDRQLEQARLDHRLTQKLEQLGELLTRWESQEPAMAALRESLQRAQQLAPVLILREELERSRETLNQRQASLTVARAAESQAAAEQEAREGPRARAREAARALPRHEEELDTLVGLLGPATELRKLQEQVARLGARLEELTTRLEGHRATQSQASRQAEQAAAEADRLLSEAAELKADPAREATLGQAQALVADWESAREKARQQTQESARDETRRVERETALRDQQARLASERDNRAQAQAAVDQARATLEALRQGHAVHALRAELADGEPCPVCLQAVGQVPANPEPAGLAPAQQALEAAELELETAQQRLARAELEFQSCQRALELHDLDAKHRREQAEQAQARAEDLRARLVTIWGEPLPSDPQAALAQELARLRLQAERLARLEQAREAARASEQTARLQEAQERAQVQEVERRLSEDRQALAQDEQRLAEMGAELTRVLGELPSEGQLEQRCASLRQLCRELEQAREASERDYQQAASALELARQRVVDRREAVAGAQAEVDRRQDELAAELRRHGLADEEALGRQSLSPRELERRREELDQHTSQGERLRGQLQEAESQRTRPVPAQELQALIEAAEAGRLAQQDRERRLADLRAELQGLERSQAAVAEHTRRRDELKARVDNFAILHRLLGQTGLKEHVANELLTRVLELASAELQRLSGQRYTLVMGTTDLVVRDAWNGNEARDTRTLSGGETFLASLALALAMVEHLSGTTPLESLFIDEGFGTLDEETLGVVADTLDGLQGRLVGVISHVDELAERLPVRIRVRKGPRGSTVARD